MSRPHLSPVPPHLAVTGLLLGLIVWHINVAAAFQQHLQSRQQQLAIMQEKSARRNAPQIAAIRVFALTESAELRVDITGEFTTDLQDLRARFTPTLLQSCVQKWVSRMRRQSAIRVQPNDSQSSPRFLATSAIRAIRVETIWRTRYALSLRGSSRITPLTTTTACTHF